MSAQDESPPQLPTDRPVGKWTKGMRSPNPGGRPKAADRLQDLARVHTEDALAKIIALMNDPKATRLVQLAAAREILDRGHGRPAQSLQISPPPEEQPVADREVAQRMAFILQRGMHAAALKLSGAPEPIRTVTPQLMNGDRDE